MDTCILCKSRKKDDVQYGEFLKKDNMGLHTFCLYLSSNLEQNGNDDEGFLGFLEADIKKEVRRISQLKCYYCHNLYAGIGCCGNKCRRSFHFICGLKNNCENQFCHDYRSYCHTHIRKVKQRPSPSETCLICYDSIFDTRKKFNAITMIQAPCCRNGWFHKLCLQKFAKTSGYFFKCPLCNDAKVFREKLPVKGIYIPNQDAAWELEPNAFAELLERPCECAAFKCENKQGRKANNSTNPLIMCSTCGSTAMHKHCLPGGDSFHCADCTIVIEEADSGYVNHRNYNYGDDEEEIDVCNVSEKEDLEIIRGLIANKGNEETQKVRCKDSGVACDRRQERKSTCKTIGESESSVSKEVEKMADSDKPGHSKCTKTKSTGIFKTIITISESSSEEEEENVEELSRNSAKNINLRKRVSTSSEEDVISPIKPRRKRKLTVISNSDNEDISLQALDNQELKAGTSNSKKREKNIFVDDSCNDDDDTITSEDDVIMKTKRRRNLTVISDSDYEDIPCKLKRVEDQILNTQHSKISVTSNSIDDEVEVMNCVSIEDSDSDVDPLDDFAKCMERQKHVSCIALRTRKKSIKSPTPNDKTKNQTNVKGTTTNTEYFKTPQNIEPNRNSATSKEESKIQATSKGSTVNTECFNRTNAKTSIDLNVPHFYNETNSSAHNAPQINNRYRKAHTNEKRKTSQFKPLRDETNSNAHNVLDVSCIAKRTRRRSLACMLNNNSQKENKEEMQNVSCIAARTRRRTICAQSAKEHLQANRHYEMSQIYEKLHDSTEDEFETIPEEGPDESSSSDESDTNNFMVPDDYKEKANKFELSCIANRTRKRKSLKLELQKIDELGDSSQISCSSSSSSSRISSTYSISSSSSLNNVCDEASDGLKTAKTQNSAKTKTIPPSILVEKLPPHNYTAILSSKYNSELSTNSAHNYYPYNQYHPHCNNRKRV